MKCLFVFISLNIQLCKILLAIHLNNHTIQPRIKQSREVKNNDRHSFILWKWFCCHCWLLFVQETEINFICIHGEGNSDRNNMQKTVRTETLEKMALKGNGKKGVEHLLKKSCKHQNMLLILVSIGDKRTWSETVVLGRLCWVMLPNKLVS